jgi:hypothetical protein
LSVRRWTTVTGHGETGEVVLAADYDELAIETEAIRRMLKDTVARHKDQAVTSAKAEADLLIRCEKLVAPLRAIVAIFEDENESGDSDTWLKILDIAEKALRE